MVSPLYTAVMVCAPAEPKVVVRLAEALAPVAPPATPVTVTGVPMVVPPFLKVMVPPGAAAGARAEVWTVAVSVAFCPAPTLAGPAPVVILLAGVIEKVSAVELLALKLGSPLYCATIELAPPLKRTGPVNAALSVLTPTLLARVAVALSTKSTVPVATHFPRLPLSVTSARKKAVCG